MGNAPSSRAADEPAGPQAGPARRGTAAASPWRPACALIIVALAGVAAGLVGIELALRVETDLARRAEAVAAPLTRHPLSLEADGYRLRVAGLTDSAAERQAILAALHGLDPAVTVQSALAVLPRAQPYRFSARRLPGGEIALSGAAPSAAIRARLAAAALHAAGGAGIRNGLTLATGAPEGDWLVAVEAGIAALGRISSGRIDIDDRQGVLIGQARAPAALEAARTHLTAGTAITWSVDLAQILPRVVPYDFSASITQGRNLVYHGHAGDRASAARLRRAAEAQAPRGQATGQIQLAEGMPGADWPALVERALAALAALRDATLVIRDHEVTITGTAADDIDMRYLRAKADPGWRLEITLIDPAAHPSLIIQTRPDAPPLASGRLPAGLTRTELAESLPEVTAAADLKAGTQADVAGWRDVLQAVATALPRLAEGEILIARGRVVVLGRLRPGFAIPATRAGLRAILPGGWDLDFRAIEPPPPAEARLNRDRRGRILIAGLLPRGITAGALPAGVESDRVAGLGEGADGDAGDWQRVIGLAARLLSVTQNGRAKLAGQRLTITGRLDPGLEIAPLATWLAQALGPDWRVDLEGLEALPAAEGQIRRNPMTGESEVLTHGYWLPELAIRADGTSCETALADLQRARRIGFVAGSARLAPEAEALVDRLASLGRHCLPVLADRGLATGGHTDARGEAAANMALSERRAMRLRDALAARGVPAARILAAGHGETRPLADNETEAGRALNRRISLDWVPLPETGPAATARLRANSTTPATPDPDAAEKGAEHPTAID